MVGLSSSSDNIELINNLDAGNPLHIQTNDNSNIALIPFKLLGTENYRVWASALKLALQARNKFSFVDGSCLKESYATIYSDNAASVWKDLESTYDKVDGSVIFNLLQKINNMKQGARFVAM
ncbi:ribonuclease H-like domain-containing protein [Tanacetum coccineum]